MRKQQRLVLCLDGTWNNKDDSTNVLNHFALVVNGQVPSEDNAVTQIAYYQEGVGTGVLDSFTGGSFGFGLEENVRHAYDWLVEHFHDDGVKPDEIYIFGFSRGAFTARSLVGFISTFGILRRGAPLSVNQLWSEYCLLGRAREGNKGLWDRLFGEPKTQYRRINDLIADPWRIEQVDSARMQSLPDTELRGLLVDPREMNASERLLATWSRRARITFLGVYDTVGAIGLDALAIPGLTSRLAMHHNMRPTSLIKRCRHALAVDEHRSAFSHTPFLEFVGHGREAGDAQLNALMDEDAEEYWVKSHAAWRSKIEQRWFVGAHSNIGGGYPNNELAQIPLLWLLEGARKSGLECEESYSGPELKRLPLQQVLAGASTTDVNAPKPRDSYAEFASPFFTTIIRGKRFYRTIDPPPEVRANSEQDDTGTVIAPGYSLQSINEQIDPSVFAFAKRVPTYRPPNLHEWAKRKLKANEVRLHADPVSPDVRKELSDVAAWTLRHDWLGESMAAHLVLVLWAAFGALGLTAMHQLFVAADWQFPIRSTLGVVAFVLALVDWRESRSNFSVATGSMKAWNRALLDSVYWTRTIGFVLFVCGAIAVLARLCGEGWHAESLGSAWSLAWGYVTEWWSVPALAAAGVIVANMLDRAPRRRWVTGFSGATLGVVTALAVVPAVTVLAWFVSLFFRPMLGYSPASSSGPANNAALAGELLLLQFAIAYRLKSLSWLASPMMRANLRHVSIFQLQRSLTPAGVCACLERWRRMLACQWDESDQDSTHGPAAHAMRRAVRQALWRDTIGFIPVYVLVFGYGLWFASHPLHFEFLNARFGPYDGLPVWCLLPLVAAAGDLVENAVHLRYITLHERGEAPSFGLTPLAFAGSVVKWVAVTPAWLLTLAAVVLGSWQVLMHDETTGWRGTVALLISLLAAFAVVAVMVSVPVYRWRSESKSTRSKDALSAGA
jgi:uncharacterized protein (DUF2235 family)